MIKSICLLTSHKCLLSYDGKKFQVLGDSPVAQGIKYHAEDKEGLFYKIIEEAEDGFDPVNYWYTSSMNFADENPPQPYSNELFELLKEELLMLEKEKS